MNHMHKVAEILNIEIAEEFKIKEGSASYELRNDGIYCKTTACYNHSILVGLLDGSLEIIKLPWIPKEATDYYVPDGIGKICAYTCRNDKYDIIAIKNKMAFKTKLDAYNKGIELGWEMLPLNEEK